MPKYKKKHKVPMQFVNPNMKAIMDASKLRQASYAYRHELLLHTQRINYQSEYDRIRGVLDHTNLPDHSIARLNARRNKLHTLINDNLYPSRQ